MAIPLSHFLAQLGQAGQHASDAAAQAMHRQIEEYCTYDEDGNLVPRVMCMTVGDQIVHIPLLSLIPSTHLTMDTLRVEFETDVRLDDPPPIDPDLPPDTPLPAADLVVGLKNGLAEQDTHIMVTAVFRMTEPNESYETLRDKLNEQLKGAVQNV